LQEQQKREKTRRAAEGRPSAGASTQTSQHIARPD